MSPYLVVLEIRGVLERAVGVVSLILATVAGGVTAALAGTSPSTEYSPATVVSFGVYALGWLGLIAAAYLGACVGAEDYEQGVAKEQHLAGRSREAVAAERLLVAACVSFALLFVGFLSSVAVAAGQAVARMIGSGSLWPETTTPGWISGTAVVAIIFSGFMGFSLASIFRSRLMGVLGWLGGIVLYASTVASVAKSGPLAADVMRYLPFGPVLSGLLGEGNYIDRNVGITSWSTCTSLVSSFLVMMCVLVALADRRSVE